MLSNHLSRDFSRAYHPPLLFPHFSLATFSRAFHWSNICNAFTYLLVLKQVLKAFHASVLNKLHSSHPTLKILSEQVQSSMNELLSPQNYDLLSDSLPARDLAYSLARIYIGMALHVYIYGLLTRQEVKMAGYWPSCCFACLCVHKHAKKERGQ